MMIIRIETHRRRRVAKTPLNNGWELKIATLYYVGQPFEDYSESKARATKMTEAEAEALLPRFRREFRHVPTKVYIEQA